MLGAGLALLGRPGNFLPAGPRRPGLGGSAMLDLAGRAAQLEAVTRATGAPTGVIT